MVNDKQLRRNWRINWLSSIQEIADLEAQRRTWLDYDNTNPHYSYVEYVCCYFDTLLLSQAGYEWALRKGFVTPDESQAVQEFHRIFDAYRSPKGDYDHEAILADPKWGEVVTAAQHAQATLMSLLGEEHERRALTEP